MDRAAKEQGKLDRSDAKLRELMDKADESMKKLRETTQAYGAFATVQIKVFAL